MTKVSTSSFIENLKSQHFFKPEILAPAGNWDCASAAVENGADAIYFGLDSFNARMRADNFTVNDLPQLMQFLHSRGVRGYVTFNTLVFTDELNEAEDFLKSIIRSGVDAAIVQDIGITQLIRSLSPDFPIHTSTQMSITSAAGVEFAKKLGAQLVVVARENSLAELDKIQSHLDDENKLPLETFVHGALCVAYSGQCLTSEALGGRSANRGECAQACRMTYEMSVDGEPFDLGNKKYLLSPQDLSGISVIPELYKIGIQSFKIEGRLKTPEYVAQITGAYRQALDKCMAGDGQSFQSVVDENSYSLEMAFSRGLHTGWLNGIDNQSLVHARFAKKRGVLLGRVRRVAKQTIWVDQCKNVEPGDGIAIENHKDPDTENEIGGSVSQVIDGQNEKGLAISYFGKSKKSIPFHLINDGDYVWKTKDPKLEKEVRTTFGQDKIRYRRPIQMMVSGSVGSSMKVEVYDAFQDASFSFTSEKILEQAEKRPLDVDFLKSQFGRLGNTPFYLGHLEWELGEGCILPVSEINRMRREIVDQLLDQRIQSVQWATAQGPSLNQKRTFTKLDQPELSDWSILIRLPSQLSSVVECGFKRIYCDFEDPKKYRDSVAAFRSLCPDGKIFLAPPRIFKPGEEWILKQVSSSNPDGILVRNYDHLSYFKDLTLVGDFSLNVANPFTADYFLKNHNLERLTLSYDLNVEQVLSLLNESDASSLELTLHQRMPMFHMEHCVFCAFLSDGKDYRDCGRPCEKHRVELKDRVGESHYLKADAGCRNTLYNSRIQTGAEHFHSLKESGLNHFRIEFLNDSPDQVRAILETYRELDQGHISGEDLWQKLKIKSQLGVTRGQFQHAEHGAWGA